MTTYLRSNRIFKFIPNKIFNVTKIEMELPRGGKSIKYEISMEYTYSKHLSRIVYGFGLTKRAAAKSLRFEYYAENNKDLREIVQRLTPNKSGNFK